MYTKIGSLRDLKLAKEIIGRLEEDGFSCQLTPDPNDNALMWIEALPAEKAFFAKVLFAQYLGLMPKYDLPIQERPQAMGKMRPVTKVLFYTSLVTFILQIYTEFQLGPMIFETFFLFGKPQETILFESIRHMDLWRLLTPMFLHFGVMHILFNTLALKDFGTALEVSQGSKFVLWLTLISAFITNVFQYCLTGPMFGGMSGVVYAFFGHFLGRQMMKKTTAVKIPKQAFIWLIVWFFATFLPGPIQFMANGAHLSGLLVGVFSGIGLMTCKDRKKWFLSVAITLAGFGLLILLELFRLGGPLYVTQKPW